MACLARILCALVSCSCDGAGVGLDGDWSFAEAGWSDLHLESGSYTASGVYGGNWYQDPVCHEAGAYSVVGGTEGFNGTSGSDVVLETQGVGCMPARALFWNGGNQLWARKDATSFWFVYQRR